MLRILLVGVLAAAGAQMLRRYLVEPDRLGELCSSVGAPAWCLVRAGVIAGFVHNVYGYVSVFGALAALLMRYSALAWLALAAGVLGCVLYRFDPAGAGVLLAALTLARLGASRDQAGAGQQ